LVGNAIKAIPKTQTHRERERSTKKEEGKLSAKERREKEGVKAKC
jgi:hypothetical protein